MSAKTTIKAIKFLGVDMINKANSGHPGIVLGAATSAYALWKHNLRISKDHAQWWNRDRFILSAGHGSALLYSLLHISGYNITLEDTKQFRQFNEKVAGHPEYNPANGIEFTTGPLGQGLASSVGVAIAEEYLAAKFNKEKYKLFDYHTYVICGDGDLQEGVSYEAMSLAGHLKLKKLIVLYDSNDIQLDGVTAKTTSRDNKSYFKSLGWNYILVKNSKSVNAISKAIAKAKHSTTPTMIEIKSIIGEGTKFQGTSKVHGAPIGEALTNELRVTEKWKYEPFKIPKSCYADMQEISTKNNVHIEQWNKMWEEYKTSHPTEAQALINAHDKTLHIEDSWFAELHKKEKDATRNIGGTILKILQEKISTIIGGSADLVCSTKAGGIDGDFEPGHYEGRNINYGVREFAMTCAANGINSTKLLSSFSSTFFVFTDYVKPALRLAALMHLPHVGIYTHDSVAVGEDGPTHEPIEQLLMLRSIPNHDVIRPADTNETIGAYKIAFTSKTTPTSIVLTRQNIVNQRNTSIEEVKKGMYVVEHENGGTPDLIVIATGSELSLAVDLKKHLVHKNIRVVSAPSLNLFDKQSQEYKDKILPRNVKKLVLEAGVSLGWYKYVGQDAKIISIDHFGESGDGETLLKKLGFELNSIINKIA